MAGRNEKKIIIMKKKIVHNRFGLLPKLYCDLVFLAKELYCSRKKNCIATLGGSLMGLYCRRKAGCMKECHNTKIVL